MKIDYCHLHVHTEYSMLDGMGTTKQYAQRASKLGFKYLGITDHGSIDGLIKFQKACLEHDIKPVLGCEMYIIPELEEGKKERKRGHICLFAKNQEGFTNMCKLLTFAHMKGFYYRPRITYEILLEHCKGLVISTACPLSFLRTYDNGERFFGDLYDSIGEDLYCEIMPHNTNLQKNTNKLKIKIAKKYGRKVILTNDCHYVKKADFRAQEVLLAIQRKAKWTDKNRWRFDIRDMHLRSSKEMVKAVKEIGFYKKEYLTNTIEVAEKCSNFIIPKMKVQLPKLVSLPSTRKAEKSFLFNYCRKVYKERFNERIEKNEVYYNRLKEEYDLIIKKNFHRYLLIVWEFVNWCKENDIAIGPNRGSAGGSLINYLLNITTIDPIKHKLIFSRFINEDRIDFPDIDIDFEHEKRHLVRKHLETVYGYDRVAGVSSFNRMKSKAIVKDVARVFDVPFKEVNEFTKFIEDNEDHTGIKEAIDKYEQTKEFAEKYPKVIKYAKALEGQIKNYGKHAAALVLSKKPIGASGRCCLLRSKDGDANINWEKDDTEYVGLIKIDVLGLKQLSVLAEAKRLVKQNKNVEIDFNKIDLDDDVVFKDVSEGNTIGIFQFGTYASTALAKEMGIEKFQHLSDATSLVRPGPAKSGMTAEYIRRKHGGRWQKKHKIYEKITKDTHGVIVYQEQVMEVISEIAGLHYSVADNIRKIIGKKRGRKDFKKYERQFIKGCKKTGYFNRREAIEFWEGLQEHAQYSFNKAHSVGYSVISYWCLWLKHYYPTEFVCASLSYIPKSNKQQKNEMIEEAYRLGLNVILPKVGKSDPEKWIAKGNKLYIPFKEVKGLGPKKSLQASVYPNPNEGIKMYFGKKKKAPEKHKGELGKLLTAIGAYDVSETVQVTEEAKGYFDFRISSDPKDSYKNLFKLFGKVRLDRVDGLLNGNPKVIRAYTTGNKLIRKRKFKGHKTLLQCKDCKLIEECTRPVPPSPGTYNIVCVAEAPGPKEDELGEGLVGASGDKVWKAIGKKKYPRELFHVSNINKCYPSKSGKPSYEQMKVCGSKYFQRELKRVKPILIFAMGGTPLYYFTGRKSGIRDLSGKIQWSEEYSAWIVWCMHPAATLHNPDNQTYFDAGVKSFKRMLKILLPKNLA